MTFQVGFAFGKIFACGAWIRFWMSWLPGSLFPVGVRSGGQRCKNPVLGSHIPDLNALAFAAVISYLHSTTLCSALPHTFASTHTHLPHIPLRLPCPDIGQASLLSCSEHGLLSLRYLCCSSKK